MTSHIKSFSERGKRVFSEVEARAVIEEVVKNIPFEDELEIQLGSWWGAGQKWARNRAALTSDQREVTLLIRKPISHVKGFHNYIYATSNQFDSESLKGICHHINFYYKKWKEKTPPDRIVDIPNADVKGADVWSDRTFERSIIENAEAVEKLTRLSEAEGLMSAGYIETAGSTALHYSRDEWGRVDWQWGHVTQAQCSVTVRDAGANGSSWSGATSFDINRVDIDKISNYALERCKMSMNPVRIEPGRYQVILEPQATSAFIDMLMHALVRGDPERLRGGPFLLGLDQSIGRYKSKMDLKIVDERISIFNDPADPHFGSHISPLHKRADFIKNGILTGMSDDYRSNLNEVSNIFPVFPTGSYRVTGGHTPIEEMISSSKRAILVTRVTQPHEIDLSSLLYSGLTRDGLWLIEDGKITKAIRNFRWTESPLFVLNNIEQIGVEEQVFSPVTSRNPLGYSSFSLSLNNVVVPPLKVNDFSFTSTIDAV